MYQSYKRAVPGDGKWMIEESCRRKIPGLVYELIYAPSSEIKLNIMKQTQRSLSKGIRRELWHTATFWETECAVPHVSGRARSSYKGVDN